MAHFIANGTKISYQQFGDGPDVVLIHGLGANRAFWFLQTLQALKTQYRVTMYDLRGHGYSSMPAGGYTTADMSEDLAGLMDHLDIPSAVLIGHSFGGVVGLHYATANPQRVRGIALADSRVHSLQPAQRLQDRPDALSSQESLLITDAGADWEGEAHVGLRLLEEFARKRVDGVVSKREGQQGFVPFGGSKGGDRSARRWLQLLDTTTARNDFRSIAGLTAERIASFDRPFVSIYGERSRCLETCTKLRQKLPHSDTIIVPGAGHFHPVTRPRIFSNIVLDFVEMVTTIEGELVGAPQRLWGEVSSGDRRAAANDGRKEWVEADRRAARWERRVAWRKRGWTGPERRLFQRQGNPRSAVRQSSQAVELSF